MEIIGTAIHGIYRDILKGEDDKIIYDSGWVSNTVVDSCRLLLAAFIKNEQTNGIQFLAVGKGLEEWDKTGAPAPDPATTTDLTNRYQERIPFGDLVFAYLDQNDNELQPGQMPTNRLQITATLKPGYPKPEGLLQSYPLREFGLFGKFGNTDYMIDCIRHPVIHKDVSATLIRVVRLYF